LTPDEPAPSPGRGSLQGRTLAGGPRTRARFADFLNLESDSGTGPTRITAAAWVSDHVEVQVEGPEGQTLVLFIDRARADKPRLVANRALSLYYRGPRMWPDLESRLRKVGLDRFEVASIEDLAELIGSDPNVDPARDRVPRVDGSDQKAFDRQALLHTWGSADVWYQFFAVAEIARGRLDSLDIFDRCTFIQHCDRDCLQVSPRGPVPMVDRVQYPWVDRLRKIGRPRTASARSLPQSGNEQQSSMYTTDLNEHDVVMGGLPKLEKVLDHVLGRGVDNMLFLSCTCVPFVTGEDVESVVRRYQKKTGKPFFFLTTTPQSSVGVFRDVLVRQRKQAEALTTEVDPRAVNLIGYSKGPALSELTDMLAQAGVRVNAVFIPEMDFSAIGNLPRAPLHVLYPNALWQSLYDQLLFDSRIRSVAPAAPFGVAGTRRWLSAVAAAAGADGNTDGIFERAFNAHRAEWTSLQAEASGERLGIVAGADDIHRLCDSAATWGVPLLGMIEEMGFSLDIMIGAGDRASTVAAATKVQAMFCDPSRHSIRAFRDQERLQMLLRDGKFAAAYSDHLFDHRLSSAGKAQFSLQHFEPGIVGALGTARRLIDICRLPFYRRYHRFLPAEPEPKRQPIAPGAGQPRSINKLAGPGGLGDGLRG
jgi:hypothetical protein